MWLKFSGLPWLPFLVYAAKPKILWFAVYDTCSGYLHGARTPAQRQSDQVMIVDERDIQEVVNVVSMPKSAQTAHRPI